MIATILTYAWNIFWIYVVGMMTLAATLAANQERKIWAAKALPSLRLHGLLKVFLLNIVWFVGCFIGTNLSILLWVLTCGSFDLARACNTFVERWVGHLVLTLFVGQVHIEGRHHVPVESSYAPHPPAPVFIANHASQLDVAAVYQIHRRFKWIAKHSVLYLPGVGQVMWFGDHVLIQRGGKTKKKSVSSLFDKSRMALEVGIPMFFFPQGTRRLAERLPFKDGAFIVALASKAPLVPISIDIPDNAWNSYYPLSLLWSSVRPIVKLTVHAPIPVTGEESRESLRQACFDKIYSVLPIYKEDDAKQK
jgi:1-acyl-sn-glycerol-3-phosphate acyltransferase